MRDLSRHCPTSRVRLGLPRQQLMIRFSTSSSRCSTMRDQSVILTREVIMSSDLPGLRLIYDLDRSVVLLSGPRLNAIIGDQNAGGRAIDIVYRCHARKASFKRKSWISGFSMSIRFINIFMTSRYVNLLSNPAFRSCLAFVRKMIDFEIS